MSNAAAWLADDLERQRQSYELTQKLTYFVVSLELVFCGYLLLNADKLIHFNLAPYLFVASGFAATMGLFWRFCYNMTYHARAHSEQGTRAYRVTVIFQIGFYYVYVVLSILTIFSILVSGYVYIEGYPKFQGASVVTVNGQDNKNKAPDNKVVRSTPAKLTPPIPKPPAAAPTDSKKPKG